MSSPSAGSATTGVKETWWHGEQDTGNNEAYEERRCKGPNPAALRPLQMWSSAPNFRIFFFLPQNRSKSQT